MRIDLSTYFTITANNYTGMTLERECGRDEEEKKKIKKKEKRVVAGLTPVDIF